MMKRFLTFALTLAFALPATAQTFDSQAAAAHAAVQQLQASAEAKVAADAQQISTLNASNSSLTQQNAALSSQVTSLAAQLQTLKSTVTYRDLEWGVWSLNSATNVGGSANGTSSFTQADTNKPAVFSVSPTVLPGGNYFDVLATQKKKPNATFKNFYLSVQWDFPTDLDMNSAQCVEMEMRQVFAGMAAVPAMQMNFNGNTLRYFDRPVNAGGRGWVATGIPMPRSRRVTAVLEAHRDDTLVYYDAITINGTRYPLTVTEAIFPLAWADRLSVAVQLDSHNLPFKVSPSAMLFSSW